MNLEELTGRLHAFLDDGDVPVMIGHRFLTDIHGVSLDTSTLGHPVLVIESTGVGYERVRPQPETRCMKPARTMPRAQREAARLRVQKWLKELGLLPEGPPHEPGQ